MNKLDLQTRSWNGTCSYVGDLLYYQLFLINDESEAKKVWKIHPRHRVRKWQDLHSDLNLLMITPMDFIFLIKFFFIFKIKKFYYYYFLNIYFYLLSFLFLAALGLHCCTRAFSSCGKQGLLLVVVHGLLIAVASLVAEHGL